MSASVRLPTFDLTERDWLPLRRPEYGVLDARVGVEGVVALVLVLALPAFVLSGLAPAAYALLAGCAVASLAVRRGGEWLRGSSVETLALLGPLLLVPVCFSGALTWELVGAVQLVFTVAALGASRA